MRILRAKRKQQQELMGNDLTLNKSPRKYRQRPRTEIQFDKSPESPIVQEEIITVQIQIPDPEIQEDDSQEEVNLEINEILREIQDRLRSLPKDQQVSVASSCLEHLKQLIEDNN